MPSTVFSVGVFDCALRQYAVKGSVPAQEEPFVFTDFAE